MQAFSRLYAQLDGQTASRAKLAALQAYFSTAEPRDAAWAAYFLAGGKPRQTVPTARLRALACRLAGLPDWLFEACYQAVGDLAETLAHILPPPLRQDDTPLADWVEQRLLPLRGAAPELQDAALQAAFESLPAEGRFLLVKLIGGGFRVGVGRQTVIRALAALAGLPDTLVAQRMMGYTEAGARIDAARYLALIAPPEAGAPAGGQPYPFFLAHPLEAGGPVEPEALAERLGPCTDWLAEWKADGIRAQLVCRPATEPGGPAVWLWSRGEELVSERFPEVLAAARALPPGTVLDGELLVWPGAPEAAPASFAVLQTRLNRKTLPRKLLAEAPVRFWAYDLLESEGVDRRAEPQHQRRARLQALLGPGGPAAGAFPVSPQLVAADWPALARQRAEARALGFEGLMLKHAATPYGVGRRKPGEGQGGWWKWKLEPYRVDAVLIHAQRGHGRRASLYTDYGFAVWNRPPRDAQEVAEVCAAIAERRPPPPRTPPAPGEPEPLQLLSFAKAYSGLSDAEILRVDREIRRHTVEKFGPVRSVVPTLVVELGFEGLAPSARHRSGIALRFPRMLRLREDKPLAEADTLAQLQALLPGGAKPGPAGR
ncbi:cisplatin damage response ATP-dependent DNA ligase [Piscinibacter sp. Jin2]|uniref:Cisplatin damage response ATP-dependent DNA ligase n=1 Tax=Aquariibacter lacus TaxID=2801332 RepID=A0A9X0XDJ9_9BURK|nr:cisplatin damage response ATP-dependent DNA ligase [Piscinibacter lacus]MBL0719063.1 cisplatin damage response ATP-dependent DNA ligase [Piscinibacter lacus]